MNDYIAILFLFLKNREVHRKYSNHVDIEDIGNDNPELAKLFYTVETLRKEYPEKESFTLRELFMRVVSLYPRKLESREKVEAHWKPIFLELQQVGSMTEPGIIQAYVDSIAKRKAAFRIAEKALHFSNGNIKWEEFFDHAKKAFELSQGTETVKENEFITSDFETLKGHSVNSPGFRWRLGSLNKTLGSLRKGNFGFIFARPEVGKTAFLLSEGTYFAEQSDGPIIWFDNEEEGHGIQRRIISCTLGIPTGKLWNESDAFQRWKSSGVGEKLRLYSNATIDRRSVERLCQSFSPRAIFFNNIDKIHGFDADRHDLKLKDIYQWSRELSKEYGPVIGVSQAGGTAEGKKFLQMDDVDSSHTAKQGEADWILGIGMSHEQGKELYRYFHLCKNKLEGDADTEPTRRHDAWVVSLDPEISRYEDIGE
jgi:hypothetical protein